MVDSGRHLLEVQNLSVDFHTRYGTLHAVRGVSWHIDQGETLAIIGESGSGKSVSTSAIMGLIDTPPGVIRSGRILYEGDDLLAVSEEKRRSINGGKIGMVFQDTLAALNPVYPIGWQVAETFRSHGVASAQANKKALELLEVVGLRNAPQRFSDYPHQFSGGQRQRIMIAMAIALRPNLLIADEPTTALDVTVQARILELLKELQKETGMGLLLITHDLGVVSGVADRIAVMKAGEIVETGTVKQIFEAPTHAYTKKLLNAIPGRHGFPACDGLRDREKLLVVSELAKHYTAPARMFRRGAATVERALDGVSFELHRGETLGVVGESGSGKSTLARTLLGLETTTSGVVHFRGRNITSMSKAEFFKIRRHIQMVFQDPSASLNPRMTVQQIISEPWTIHADVLPCKQWRSRVGELLEQVGLKASDADRNPHQFSGGQRQRIAIARALALRPEIIICDEAVSSLDVSIQAQVIALLKQLKADYGLSYLFIAHNLPVVADFADRLLVMYRGEIVEQGKTAEVFANPQHRYTKDLLASDPVLNISLPAVAPLVRVV
ncbi:MAG: transporter ATP-binding protein [Herbaspirillum sp.]|nr:transporter ATP-binding protein [Herbaspirillum sp.]